MTLSDSKLLQVLLFILGAGLIFSGWQTIIRRRTRAEGRECEGRPAARLGWLWVAIGILLLLAAVFNIPILRAFGRLFLESNS